MLLEEGKRLAQDIGGHVAVATEFDVQSSLIVDLSEAGEYVVEIDLPFSEAEVIVLALAHVFDVDVKDALTPGFEIFADGQLPHALQMTDVDSQSETGVINEREQFLEISQRLDEHTRLRFECQTHFFVCSVVDDLPTAGG